MTRLNIPQQLLLAPYSNKILAVASTDEHANAASFAYNRLMIYRAAAAVQMRRLWVAAHAAAEYAQSNQPPSSAGHLAQMQFIEAYREASAALIYETHYYFITWHNCNEMLEVLTKDPAFLEARKAFNRNRALFEHYQAARHSFEHFADRLPGRKEHQKMVEVDGGPGTSPSKIYFGFVGDFYEHSDKKWDISRASLDRLNNAIDIVLNVLHPTIDALVAQKYPQTLTDPA